jgi:N-acetylglutamate synthase-like GNAT family acetyltransferase
MKNAIIERIFETQEESEEDDETTFTFFADGKIVSWAKTLLYSNLEEIHTVRKERHRGFGQKLLAYLEKNATEHGASTMKASYVCFNNEAAGFFRRMGYGTKPIEDSASRFSEVIKEL